jgi:hypothetical protein
MSPKITDEQLSAYLDGVGDPTSRVSIDRALLADEALCARLERLRRNDCLFRDAVEASLGPVPERLLHIASGAVPVARARRPRFPPLVEFAAIAAALVIAFVAGNLADRVTSARPDVTEVGLNAHGLAMGAAIADALSKTPSGSPTKLSAGGATLSVRLTFLASDGEYCLRFRVENIAFSQSAVACHQQNLWLIRALVSGRPETGGAPYATASGDGASDTALDAAIDRIGVQRTLDRADEAAAIRSAWNNKP